MGIPASETVTLLLLKDLLEYGDIVPVAQLDSALASGAKGCGFESRRGRFFTCYPKI